MCKEKKVRNHKNENPNGVNKLTVQVPVSTEIAIVSYINSFISVSLG